MEKVQLTIRDARYACALQNLLERNGSVQVCRMEAPDPAQEGLIVVDADELGRLSAASVDPGRIVLITGNDPEHLAQAWNAGIRSVVFREDPLSTAVLAIMAAELRAGKPDPAAHFAGASGAAGAEQKRGL
jgi:hypothetical protein